MKNVFILYLTLLLVSCGGETESLSSRYDTLYAPRYARHFVVLSRGDSVVLRTINPWQGATNEVRDYTIAPVQRMICMSSSHTAFIDTLGCADLVVGVSSPDYFTNTRFADLPDVGYDKGMNVELIASLRPDIIAAYEISGENSSVMEKLTSFGIRPLYIADYLEDSPLARAEWVVALGAVLNRLDQGRDIFAHVESSYIGLRDRIKSQDIKPRSVMLNSPYKGVWYLPGDSSYIVQLIRDAGGLYVAQGKADNVSHAVSTEVAYSKLLEADVWLNPSSYISSVEDLRRENPLLGNIKIPVFNNTLRGGRSGGSDFWESGVVAPDRVLEDLIRIIHPELGLDGELYYYKELK